MARIVVIVGETSGDLLAAGLIKAISRQRPDVRFEGITGPLMAEAGCTSWGHYDQLAVMGLTEVVAHLPGILRVKRDIERRLREDPPDLLIGVDAPDFNLRIEKVARRMGIPTVQYVCPSVWAWRTSRVKTIRESCDLVLCLLPFERQFLEDNGVPARFVGHPLADRLSGNADRSAARQRLGLADTETVALMPGSRAGEVKYLGPAFLGAAALLRAARPGLQFVLPVAKPSLKSVIQSQAESAGMLADVKLIGAVARDAMEAADVVLLASGTATLEAMLVNRPMVVAYKVSALTAWLLRHSGLVNIRRFSLPNLLADEELVPELLQEDATPKKLSEAVQLQLDDPELRRRMQSRFADLASALRRSASEEAATGVLELLDEHHG